MSTEQITESLADHAPVLVTYDQRVQASTTRCSCDRELATSEYPTHLARDVVLPLIEQETAAVRVAYKEAEANEDRLERLLVSLLADLTGQYEKAREERDQHDEYSNYWRWLDGICEGLDRAIQRAKYAPDTTTKEQP